MIFVFILIIILNLNNKKIIRIQNTSFGGVVSNGLVANVIFVIALVVFSLRFVAFYELVINFMNESVIIITQ